jgi:LPXTG-motif cell wall-anchored protein
MRSRPTLRVAPTSGSAPTVSVRVESDSGEVDETQFTVREQRGVRPADERVTPAPGTDRLPVTGGQALLLSVLGVSLIGGGLLALRKRGDSVT